MSESAHKPQKGIDIYEMPGNVHETPLRDIFGYFFNDIPGKYLTMHYGSSAEESTEFSAPIHSTAILENGNVWIVSEDAFGNATIHELDGDTKGVVGSIYEENDVWFSCGGVFYVIYDEPIPQMFVHREE